MQGWQRHGVFPSLAFQIFGMRRSGNHAITDWLMRNAPHGSGLFFNNCGLRQDPTTAHANLDVYRDHQLSQIAGDLGDKTAIVHAPLVLVSYEDWMPHDAGKPQKASKGLKNSDFSATILIYRSFLNWSASLLRKIDSHGAVTRLRIMARAIETYTEGLRRLGQKGLVGICYDAWVSDETYRADILARLGLPCRDLSLGRVQRFGGGSSFQGQDVAVSDLNTAHRADEMAQDPAYQLLLWTVAQDPEQMNRIAAVFPQDAARVAALGSSGRIDFQLKAAS